jgi:hypothetical protein
MQQPHTSTLHPLPPQKKPNKQTNKQAKLGVYQIYTQCLLSCGYQLPATTNDSIAHVRFKNLQKQRYNYFTNANLPYETNSGSVAFKQLIFITVYAQSGTRPLSELEEKNYKPG